MKKSYGKVRRYRTAFGHTAGFWVRRVGLLAAAGLLLFLLGWVIGPAVINAGTSAWYGVKNGTASSSEPASPSGEEGQPGAAAPTEEPAAASGKWAFASLSSLTSAEQAAATAQSLAAQGVQYVAVTLKDSQGYVYYNSALPAAAQSLAANTVDASAVVSALKDAGLTPVAAICAFQDPIAARADRTMAIHYRDAENPQSDYLWLDAAANAGGKPWLNPYAASAVDYISGLIEEARRLGFEQVLLSGLQLPTNATSYCDYGSTNGVSASDQLKNDLAAFTEKAGEGRLWLSVALNTAAQESPAMLGGPLSALAPAQVMLEMPAETTEDTQTQLDAARAALGSTAVVLRTGDTAQPAEQ